MADRDAWAAEGVAAGDPFGVTRSEQLWRRFAGAGLTTLLMVGALSWWVPLIVLIACAAIYVLGIPASLVLERRWPTAAGRSPVPRYLLLGAAVGVGIAVGLAMAARGSVLSWAPVFGAVTVPAGAIAGGSAAWGARAVPETWLFPVALGAPVLASAITLAAIIMRGL